MYLYYQLSPESVFSSQKEEFLSLFFFFWDGILPIVFFFLQQFSVKLPCF